MVTSQTEVIENVLSILNDEGIPFMIVGSMAASSHGEIRDTHDMDLVVVLDIDSVRRLGNRLNEEFYVDREGAEEAVKNTDMFNIIHYASSFKVDFWVLKKDELSQAQFARRQASNAWGGAQAFVESAEDTILSKLLWNQISPSERQLGDVSGILRVRKNKLDYDYLREWAAKKGLLDTLDRLIKES
jgi:predicted nucleotidyltransferase